MVYIKNGALIRLVASSDLPRFLRQGFVPLQIKAEKPPKKPARKLREVKPHGNV